MAYVNVAEWKTEQVCEWLKGLENSVLPYVHSFMNHGVNGQQLLSLRPEDLEQFGVLKLGHQEIILEAVEYLRNFHYELDRENLQLLALRLSCQAHSLHNELLRQTDSKPVTTQTLSDVAAVMTAVKPLVRWLDCSPFSGQLEYTDKKSEVMKLAMEMATCAQRDRFAEKPIEEIRTTCSELAKLADYIIQDISDPMILQPASLDLATLKKKPGDDLGFHILPSFHGAHQIAEIKFGSAAHQCGKMEEGDEIVQVNYQTVVGWERKNLLELFRESPAEVLLTLKRRPRHTKVYGQIYIKPYRLPSNKKISYTTRWQHNLPSPRPELLTIPDFTMPLPRHMPKNPSPEPASILDTVNILDTMIIDSSDSDSEAEPPLPSRLYLAKPRNLVQRRATITGASPTTKHGIDIEQFWKELKQEHSTTFQLRDKAASCAHGLDNVPSNLRPQTCLGIEQNKRRKKVEGQIDEKKVHFQEKPVEAGSSQTDNNINIVHDRKGEKSPTNNNIDVTNLKSMTFMDQGPTVASTIERNNRGDVNVPLDECNNLLRDNNISNKKMINNVRDSHTQNVKDRGKLDKSYSTPAYDFADSEGIEDRKQKLFGTVDQSGYSLNKIGKASKNTEIQVIVDDFDKQQNTKVDSEESNDICNSTCKTDFLGNHGHQNDDSLIFSEAENQNGISKELKLHNTANLPSSVESTDDAHNNNESAVVDDDNEVHAKENMNATTEKISNPVDTAFCTGLSCPSSEMIDNNRLSDNSSEKINVRSNATVNGIESNIVSGTVIGNNKINDDQSSIVLDNDKRSCKEQMLPISSKHRSNEDVHDNSNKILQRPSNLKLQNDVLNIMESLGHCSIKQSSKSVDLIKTDNTKKFDTKSQVIPPEPPPRKYYMKSSGNIAQDNTSTPIEDNDKSLYVPERPVVRRDLKKPEMCSESSMKYPADRQERRNSFDIYSNYIDNPTELIDEAALYGNDIRHSVELDTSTYGPSSSRYMRDEKLNSEPFNDKSTYSSQFTSEYYKTEFPSQNMDSPDGSLCSKQSMDLKFKTLEKEKNVEKGVVNKAMMVARSIGLHGSLSKASSSSPRSSRKQSILFARKRNISVKDLGPGDLEGWLTYRTRGAGGAWAKAWFVLKCSSLYRFKAQDSVKADCLIALTGFTVSQAAEVKSRKYAFKVYHTGTVFYFAADTEDSLATWLDAINRATLGADGHTRNSTLFSETDESDSENKSKAKNAYMTENKSNTEKTFGSLKKVTRKDSGYKEHEVSGASLDRKYLRFLGARSQNVPVPTAQFRSYRRVLPSSTPNKKQNSIPNSPDLQMTIAGSTFYGLCTSQSATDMSISTQDMSDYRRTADRNLGNRNRRTEDLQGFITLEEFMLSQQSEERRQFSANRSESPRVTTPLINDHVHVQYTNLHENSMNTEQSRHTTEGLLNNDVIDARSRMHDEAFNNSASYGYSRNLYGVNTPRQYNGDLTPDANDTRSEYTRTPIYDKYPDLHIQKRKPQDNSTLQSKTCNPIYTRNTSSVRKLSTSMYQSRADIGQNVSRQAEVNYEYNSPTYTQRTESWGESESTKSYNSYSSRNIDNLMEDFKTVPKRFLRNDGYSGSSSDLTLHASSEVLQHAKKDTNISRKGSFNLNNRRESIFSDKHWLESLKRSDKKNNDNDKNRLKHVAQYQPPPIPSSPFEQEGMRAAFEMHLDKAEQVQKTNRLKSLFGSKTQQKPSTLDIPKDGPKTLLGSPRLHRAVFRDKSSNQTKQRVSNRLNAQSPSDHCINQPMCTFNGNSSSQILSQSFSSTSFSNSDASPSASSATRCPSGHPLCQKGFGNLGRNSLTSPTLPYIPPPTSPPPDYPDLEYPPVFEPGTYSISDASILRNRSKDNQNSS